MATPRCGTGHADRPLLPEGDGHRTGDEWPAASSSTSVVYSTLVEKPGRGEVMSRQTDIADAAIATLARDGMRGLTHRAVDRTAGLPEGSTSYYFRTRQALLQAAIERLAEVDASEIPALPHDDPDALAHAAAELVERWLTTGRERQLARYELALEATRRPHLREVLVASG